MRLASELVRLAAYLVLAALFAVLCYRNTVRRHWLAALDFRQWPAWAIVVLAPLAAILLAAAFILRSS